MSPGIRLVVLGIQGAGKGTQCVRLSHHYVASHISTGEMFRVAVMSRTAIGVEARALVDAGELVPDKLVMAMVRDRLEKDDTRHRGFVLDGCPRTVAQAEALAELLAPDDIDMAIDLVVPASMVMRRLLGRRVCVDCGANYHVNSPPKVNWTCDICGGEVVQRRDDSEDAIRRRLALYGEETVPLIAWYRARGQLESANGVGSPDAVTARLIKTIDARIRRTWGPRV